jgi:tripartite-type tricarboxylate transporter receptor subunit TctC
MKGMTMLRRRALLAAPLAAATPLRAEEAWAPSRGVTLIVPLAPGSTADILARTLAEVWAGRLGQPVTVDNRPAAGGVVATEQLKAAAPDGLTIGLQSQGTLVFNTHLARTPRYDPLADFTMISPFAVVTNALVVPRDSPVRTLADLVAAARARPGAVTYSSGGNGTSHHISMALLAQKIGADLTHVPYRGAPAGILAVIRGEVMSGCYNIPTVLTQIRAGELRALGVTSRQRSEFLPEVPSLAEQGIADYELTTWMALAGPARLPAAAVARYAAETERALADPAVWARLRQQGFEPIERMPPARLAAFLREDLDRWGPVIRASGATID